MARHVRTPLLLTILAVIFFWPLVRQPGHVLYSDHSDVLAQHVPYKCFLVRSWHETGEIPLWCPHTMGGCPFITDLQVSIFYPPNLLLLFFSEDQVPAAFSWLVVAHILMAGWLMYFFARAEGLGEAGCFVASAGFMLSGKWMLHLLPAGHTVVCGLAWLPLVVLWFDRAIRRRSVGWAAAAGVALALLVLGTQPQWTLYAGFFLLLWTAGTALEGVSGSTSKLISLTRWLGLGLATVFVGLILASVQLLPTLEAITHSCRYVLDKAHACGDGAGWVEAWTAWTGLIGPSLREHANWENQSGIGLLWAMLAAVGACWSWREQWHRTLAGAIVLAFALTGGLFLHSYPPFRMFRGPSRMLLIFSFPLALLVGRAVDRLPAIVAWQPRRLFAMLLAVAGAGVIYTGFRYLALPADERHVHAYWYVLAAIVPATLAVFCLPNRWMGQARVPMVCALLFVDLCAMSWSFVRVHRLDAIYPPSPLQEFLVSNRDNLGRVLDMQPYADVSPLGCGAPLALNLRLQAVRGYNPLDFYRYKEYLQILSDSEWPQAPHEVVNGFRIQNRALLDLFGVRYLLQPTYQGPEGAGWREVFRDDAPQIAFNYPDRGMLVLPPYLVRENEQAFPRAFVVPHATPFHASDAHAMLPLADFHNEVLIEGCDPTHWPTGEANSFRATTIQEYLPNRVTLEVDGTSPGWLVLTDMWYPGWTCTIDGIGQQVYRGDYLFRTVPVSAGKHTVVFRFFPLSYQIGRAISVVGVGSLAFWYAMVLRRKRARLATTRVSENPVALAA